MKNDEFSHGIDFVEMKKACKDPVDEHSRKDWIGLTTTTATQITFSKMS